jgi:hypothetical protein
VAHWCRLLLFPFSQFIHQLGHSEVEDQRELAFILLLELGDTLGKGMEGNLQSLKQFYMVALQDASRKVGFRMRCMGGHNLHAFQPVE